MGILLGLGLTHRSPKSILCGARREEDRHSKLLTRWKAMGTASRVAVFLASLFGWLGLRRGNDTGLNHGAAFWAGGVIGGKRVGIVLRPF